jgi:ring-1,2-phenylacetyl-CoA epoxidase subunit PaaE
MNFHPVIIKNIIQETADSYSFVCDIPQASVEKFYHKAGQYVTVKSFIGDKEIRRPYSINSLPGSPDFSFTVKKVPGGLMSNYLPSLRPGSTIEISEPEGHFILQPDHTKTRSHYFIAAGSGITPVMSMILTVLEEEPRSSCYLLYGSRDEENIIFRDKIDALCQKYQDQLHVEYIVSQPKKSRTQGVAGWLGQKKTDWKGPVGRIGTSEVVIFLQKNPSHHPEKNYYVCGPGDMIQVVEKTLLALPADSKHIHKEFFTPARPLGSVSSSVPSTGTSKVEVTLKGQVYHFDMVKNKMILDQLVEQKIDPPYSCTSGACSTCIAKVTRGEVKMDVCYALETDEIEAGYVLTCQAKAVSEDISLTYDV